MRYKTSDDPGYVLNIDNFIKMCLISYKMNANIPLVIQGEAGIGKTALLRHLIEHVYKYTFIPETINAGLTEQGLREKINNVEIKNLEIQSENTRQKQIKTSNRDGKVCIFFDEFNTSPELGYFKELMMEHRFMGEKQQYF
jgi:MoxR-like ATPase